MIDLSGFMHQLAQATESDASNQVFVYRKVLTEVYLLGHDDGMRAADRDEFVRGQIERAAKEASDG